MRSQFTFYKSFDDVIEDMSDKQIVEYVKAVLDVQFLRKRISEISFDDKVLSMVWKSQKHSITSSIDGYLNSQKKEGVTNPYFGAYATPSEGGFFTPSHDPYEGGRQQEEGKGKGKGKEEGKVEYTAELVAYESIPYKEIIDHLNVTLKTNFKQSSEKTRSLIKARFNDGFSLNDFKQVHIVKLAEWGMDAKMSKFLRPETLYSNKFEGYLNQRISDYDKSKLIQQHTGMSASELLAIQIAEADAEWERNNA